ncbi:MAG TPA: site-2 protease family protein [Gemmatimonadales bacterium]
MTTPATYYATWREISLAGDREVIDGIVADRYLGPSAELAAFLDRWPGTWYWGDDARTRLVLIRGSAPARPERWLWHGALLLLFIVCTLGAGEVVSGAIRPPAYSGISGALAGAVDFGRFVISGGWRVLLHGWEFGVPLLGILLVHELGHYFAAKRYSIDVSPPYFIPVPPNLSPIGGLGAFIRLRSPVYDRRQLLDVGAAGPLAGFVIALGVLVWGFTISHRFDVGATGSPSFILFAGKPILLGDSILVRGLRNWLVPGTGSVLLSAPAFAGWVGMFITGLNLLPLSQLDGGHVLYGVAGKAQRPVAIVVAAALVVLGTRAPMWYLWAGLTFVIGGGRWSHPDVVIPSRPVTRYGRWIALASLAVLILTFVPVPFRN